MPEPLVHSPASSCSRRCRRPKPGQNALPGPPAASAPPGSAVPTHPQQKENYHDPAVPVPSPRLPADAIVTGVALLQTFGAGRLRRCSICRALVLETGLFLIAYAALVGWLGTRQSMPKALVTIVIAGNAAWTLGSIALMFADRSRPTCSASLHRRARDQHRGVCGAAIYRLAQERRRGRGLSRGLID